MNGIRIDFAEMERAQAAYLDEVKRIQNDVRLVACESKNPHIVSLALSVNLLISLLLNETDMKNETAVATELYTTEAAESRERSAEEVNVRDPNDGGESLKKLLTAANALEDFDGDASPRRITHVG